VRRPSPKRLPSQRADQGRPGPGWATQRRTTRKAGGREARAPAEGLFLNRAPARRKREGQEKPERRPRTAAATLGCRTPAGSCDQRAEVPLAGQGQAGAARRQGSPAANLHNQHPGWRIATAHGDEQRQADVEFPANTAPPSAGTRMKPRSRRPHRSAPKARARCLGRL